MQNTSIERLDRKLKESFKLTHNNDIELKYHYGILGYLKLIAGGTALPKSVDVLNKTDKSVIKIIHNKKLLNQLADS